MIFIRSSAPHVHSLKSTGFIMGATAFALMPAAAALTFAYGFGVVWHIIIAAAAAEIFEALCMLLRKKSVSTALGDLSALLTAVIFALAVPPYLPWYLVVGGMFFGIVVVKHCFGGLGQNTFNPAMAAYVLLLVSFPGQMTAWIAPSPENLGKLGFNTSLEIISGQKTVSEAMVLRGSSMGSVRKAEAGSTAPESAAPKSIDAGKAATEAKKAAAPGKADAAVQAAGGHQTGAGDAETGAARAAGQGASRNKAAGKGNSADGATHATVQAGTDGKTGATLKNSNHDAGAQEGKKADAASGATQLNGSVKTASAGADTKTGAADARSMDGKTGATAAGKGASGKAEASAGAGAADASTHATASADAVTYATPLSKYKVEKNKNGIYYPYVKKGTIAELDISTYGVKVVSIAFLLGGLVLLVTRMISISVPLSVLGSVAFFSWMYQVLGDAGDFPVMTVTDQLLTGATMMGAFFIYTDPVGSASTTRAKIISGILIGFFIVTVRNFGGYPDAVAFGALIANSVNQLLDRLIRPIRFGRFGEAA